MTRAQHTAGISDVEGLVFVNRIREMVSFELSKEIKKDVFLLVTKKLVLFSFRKSQQV